MKFFIVFTAILVAVSAVPTFLTGAPAYYTEAIPIRNQFHAQDAIGQYSYGYSGELSARSESKSIDGVTRGAYTYVDADGKLQSVEYTADALNGFRAAATNLPRSPVDNGMAPEPVQETEEVAKARADHLAAFKEAEIRAAAAPEEPEEEEQETAEQTEAGAANEMAARGAIEGQSPASTSATAVGSIAVNAPLALPAPTLAVRTLEAPDTTSYSYHVEANNPSYTYSVATPHIYTAPLNTLNHYSYAAAPVIARSHITLNGEILGDRTIEANGHLRSF